MDSFNLFLIICVVLVLVAVCWWGTTYAQLARLRSQVDEAIGTLAAQFQQRFDLIPDTLKAARESIRIQIYYLNQILEARKQIHVTRETPNIESMDIPPELGHLTSLARGAGRNQPNYENNPQMDLKTYEKLQEIIASTEKDIAAARRFVEAAIAEYNAAICSFPGSLVASAHGFYRLSATKIDPRIADKPNYWK